MLLHGDQIFQLGWIPHHAYLAVDFFFLLSGYVIGRAFDQRLRTGWVIGFLQRRLIRLYPFIIVGSVIGFLVLVSRAVVTHALTIPQALLDLASSLLVIPTPPLLSPEWRIYPAAPPLWSLFYEIAVNVVYAILAPKLSNRLLWLLVGVSALLLAAATLQFNGADFGLVHFGLGSLRVSFSFFLGVALYRSLGTDQTRVSAPPWVTPLIFLGLAVVLLSPTPLDWAYDMLAVFLVFPVLLVAALHADPGGRRTQGWFILLGLLSYPVYAIHHPFFRLISGIAFKNAGAPVRTLAMAFSLIAVLALSWVLARFYDEPLRQWLTTRLPRGAKAQKLPAGRKMA